MCGRLIHYQQYSKNSSQSEIGIHGLWPQTSCENSHKSVFLNSTFNLQKLKQGGTPEYSIFSSTWSTQCYILLLVMLTITWLRGPLQYKVAIFPLINKLIINKSLRGDILKLCNEADLGQLTDKLKSSIDNKILLTLSNKK